MRKTFEARPAPPKKRKRPRKAKADGAPPKRAWLGKRVEGAYQKQSGKWTNFHMFPGREFDSLDEYRAAKKQSAARREEYLARARENRRGCPL